MQTSTAFSYIYTSYLAPLQKWRSCFTSWFIKMRIKLWCSDQWEKLYNLHFTWKLYHPSLNSIVAEKKNDTGRQEGSQSHFRWKQSLGHWESIWVHIVKPCLSCCLHPRAELYYSDYRGFFFFIVFSRSGIPRPDKLHGWISFNPGSLGTILW